MLIFFGQKCNSAIFITFSISDIYVYMYVGRRWPSQIIKRVKLAGQICIGNLENEDDGCFEANGGNDIVVDKVGCLV